MRSVHAGSAGRVAIPVLGALLLAVPLCARAQQLSKEQAAQLLLDSARRAYNEGKYDFAAQRFGEYVRQYRDYGGRYAAQYGLAMCLLTRPQRDYQALHDAFRDAAASSSLPERPFALYYYAAALRALGAQAERQAAAKPPAEAAKLQDTARRHFTEAANQFGSAADAFAERARRQSADPNAHEPEWAARARCDQAEAMLRLKAYPEAEKAARTVLADEQAAKGPYGPLALYYAGYARFLQKDTLEAGRLLSRLAPFDQDIGLHAQYLLARTHHLAEERPEAAGLYQAVRTGYEQRKKDADAKLKAGKPLAPEQKAALEALARGPSPGYVVRSAFYAALLRAESGKHDEAARALAELVQKHPGSPLLADAKLRLGYCHLQARRPAEAIAVLQPLAGDAERGDRATWWLARAKIAAADPKDAKAHESALAAALTTLAQAAQKAALRAKADPAAKARRLDILLESADVQQQLGRYDEAVATYRRVLAEGPSARQAEQATQRQGAALHLAGKYAESDAACRQFQQRYPRSTLLPAVLFRSAENAYFTALAAEADPGKANQLPRLYDEALRRYRQLTDLSKDFHYAHLARHGVATIHYRQGRYEEAAQRLRKVPAFERTGDLAEVSYLLADCLLRTLPPDAGDALAAARLVAQIEKAAQLLEAYLGTAGKGPKVPEALLKLAYCYRRIAEQVTDNNERHGLVQRALQACDRIQREFAADAVVPAMVLERAACAAARGDPGGAINELQKFRADPLRASDVAPLALARQAQLMRSQGRGQETVKTLADYRQQHDAAMRKDPAKRHWAAMLQYAHALGLKAAKKPDEAVTLLDTLIDAFPGTPEATNAAWRASQCRRELLDAAVQTARRTTARAGARPEQVTAAQKALREKTLAFRQSLARLLAEAENAAETTPGSPAHVQLLYEAAWCFRTLADGEVEAARQKLQAEALAKAVARLAETTPEGQTTPTPAVPNVPRAAVPVQASEVAARRQYERLIAAAPSHELAVRARLELAEMYAQRPDDAEGVAATETLLTDGLRHSPSEALAEAMRLRLASCMLAQDKPAEALGHLAGLGNRPRDYYTPAQGRYLTAEAMIRQKDWAGAAAQLKPFQSDNRLRTVGDITERALLRLGQAHAELKQWDASRQAFAALLQANRNSPWRAEAMYGMAWALHVQKRYDEAVKAYAGVTRETVGEPAARAQYQIGRCRIAQQKYDEAIEALLVVPLTYGYPEWSAAARCEAARACTLMKETARAARLYRQVVREHPGSQWAQVAREGLHGIE